MLRKLFLIHHSPLMHICIVFGRWCTSISDMLHIAGWGGTCIAAVFSRKLAEDTMGVLKIHLESGEAIEWTSRTKGSSKEHELVRKTNHVIPTKCELVLRLIKQYYEATSTIAELLFEV